jgi:molybdopterin synthase sulfur carrier subunit
MTAAHHTIRVVLPFHLSTLANCPREIRLDVSGAVTQRSVLDALETVYPMLSGTIRDHGSDRRRPLVRFFACENDLSNESPDTPLPEAVANGTEPFFIIGAIAGGNLTEEVFSAERRKKNIATDGYRWTQIGQ